MDELIKAVLVEDDPSWKKIFQFLVADPTETLFEFDYLTDCASLLDAVKNRKYDLILLDLMLPDSQAMDTIKTVTSRIKTIPIVVISTLDDDKLMHNAFLHGIEDYMVKDQYDSATFVHVCRQAIRRFIAKTSNSYHNHIHDILNKLRSIDAALAEFQKNNKHPETN